MANSRRQITVTNLPPAITEVDLELLFESRSFCPDGGDVACVKVDDDTHTAIITLEDEDVAERLVEKSEVFYYEQRLLITRPSRASDLHCTHSDSKVPISKPNRCGSQTVHCNMTLADKCCGDNKRGDLDKPLLGLCATYSKTGAAAMYDSAGQNSRDAQMSAADFCTLSDSVKQVLDQLPPVQQHQTFFSASSHTIFDDCGNDTDDSCSVGMCKNTATEQDICLASPQKSERQTEQNAKAASSSTECRKIIFSEEKLCLLEKVIASGNISFPGSVRVIVAENAVELVAADENVTESEMKLYELTANFSALSLRIPAGVVKLLQSARGQKWLQLQLAGLDAVFRFKDGACPFIVGVDWETSMGAKSRLEKMLLSKTVPFADQHTSFLQSVQWARAVEKFESEYFATVSTEYRKNEIVVEGSNETLADVVGSISMLLKQNGRLQRKITISKEQFDLLLVHKGEIQDKLESELALQQQQHSSGSADVHFDEKMKCITVAGSADSVEVATKFVKTNYVDVICRHSLKIALPGLTIEDFSKEGTGEMVVKILQMNHKCVITVQDSSAERRTPAESQSHSKRFHGRQSSLLHTVPRIVVVEGSLTTFSKADVLVNVISSQTPNLSKAGAVSAAFLDAAGIELQHDIENNWPEFGQVYRTRSYGSIQARYTYHLAIAGYRSSQSTWLLQNMVERCLEMAEKDGMSSIAFPTIGCGRLRFDPKSVADCFCRAQRNRQSTLQARTTCLLLSKQSSSKD